MEGEGREGEPGGSPCLEKVFWGNLILRVVDAKDREKIFVQVRIDEDEVQTLFFVAF